MARCVGIDLGTTHTVTAVVEQDVARSVLVERDSCLLPSVVSFHPNGEVLVGRAARARKLIDPGATIHSVKRLIGRSWQSEDVQQALGRMPFSLVQGTRDSVQVNVRQRSYALPEISAYVLRAAKHAAEQALDQPIDRAVVTVPANFNELQRAATKLAAKLADLEVLRILNEPTAAALAYGQQLQSAKRIAVFDLGGGTFDLTVLDLTSQVFEVLGTAGDSALGGDDLDEAVAQHLRRQCLQSLRLDPRADRFGWERIRTHAEVIKKQLSLQDRVTRTLQDFAVGPNGMPLALQVELSRIELEAMCRPWLERTLQVTAEALRTASLRPQDIHEVLLVGGATRMPLVQRLVAEFFGRAPVTRIDPDQVVALGAAIAGHDLNARQERRTPQRRPSSPTLAAAPPGQVLGRIALVSRNVAGESKPTMASEHPARPERSEPALPTLPTPNAEALEALTPKTEPEQVAVRAQAPLLLDVTPLTLRVETTGGYSDALIRANTPVPCERKRIFATSNRAQRSVVVRVAQGGQPRFAANPYLGEVVLDLVEPGDDGVARVEVSFSLDADGTLQIEAQDPVSLRQAHTVIHLHGVNDSGDELAAMMARHDESTIRS